MKKTNQKSNSGITLIALVVTIIVLLILAGIAISMLSGDNSILQKTTETKEINGEAEIKEKIQLAYMASYGADGNMDPTKFFNELNKMDGTTVIGPVSNGKAAFPITVITKKNTYEIDDKGNVETITPGLYYAGTNEMIMSWEELIDSSSEMLTLNNGVLTKSTFNVSNKVDKKGNTVGNQNVKLVIAPGVTSISESGMWRISQLAEVKLPNTIESIGNYAFSESPDLKSVTVLSGVVGEGAFRRENRLEEVILCNQVTSIQNSAFESNSKLKNIDIPDSVTTIGTGLFDFNSQYNISIGDGITEITKYTLRSSNCSSPCLVENVVLGNGITKIPADMFRNYCPILKSIKIGNSVTEIGDYAFCGCAALKEIDLPDSVTTIGNYVFEGCKGLENLKLSNNIITITRDTLGYNINNLKNIDLGNGITIIPDSMFYSYLNLEKVKLGNNVKKIGKEAFVYCYALKEINLSNTIEEIGNNAFYYCKSLKSINWPSGTTILEKNVFTLCEELEKIILPNTVTEIRDYAFHYCNKLKDVYYNGTETDWNRINVDVGNEKLVNATKHWTN